jgi:hypothetical protein
MIVAEFIFWGCVLWIANRMMGIYLRHLVGWDEDKARGDE